MRPDPAVAAGRQGGRRGRRPRSSRICSPGQCVVDTSTSSVALTREIGARLTARGIGYADAPVARTREAAARGELSIMVGATDAVFAHIRPILETMGTDVTHCGADRLRPGGEDPQQHAGVPAHRRAGRGDRDRPAQRRAAGGAAADHRQGLRRQLRAAQPRHEVHAAAATSRSAPSPRATRSRTCPTRWRWPPPPVSRCQGPSSPCSVCASPNRPGNGEAYHPAVLRLIDPA